MRYTDGEWMHPFGTAEASGFGWGEGSVSGDVLHGSVRWANYPRRREDGVWTPDLRGVIRTEDGAGILISIHGQSVQEDSSDVARRAILTRVELLCEDDRYRWLNTSFVVGEGEIDEETEEWWVETYVCVNEVPLTPPPPGTQPPRALRQADR